MVKRKSKKKPPIKEKFLIDVIRIRTRCPRCGKMIDPKGRDSDRVYIYLCDECSKKEDIKDIKEKKKIRKEQDRHYKKYHRCPKCGSTKIRVIKHVHGMYDDNQLNIWGCKKCGHTFRGMDIGY